MSDEILNEEEAERIEAPEVDPVEHPDELDEDPFEETDEVDALPDEAVLEGHRVEDVDISLDDINVDDYDEPLLDEEDES